VRPLRTRAVCGAETEPMSRREWFIATALIVGLILAAIAQHKP